MRQYKWPPASWSFSLLSSRWCNAFTKHCDQGCSHLAILLLVRYRIQRISIFQNVSILTIIYIKYCQEKYWLWQYINKNQGKRKKKIFSFQSKELSEFILYKSHFKYFVFKNKIECIVYIYDYILESLFAKSRDRRLIPYCELNLAITRSFNH